MEELKTAKTADERSAGSLCSILSANTKSNRGRQENNQMHDQFSQMSVPKGCEGTNKKI